MKKFKSFIMTSGALLALSFPVYAKSKAGVTMPDSRTYAGKTLTLNGLGVREATMFKVDVYVAGLYLEKATKSASSIINSDGPKVLSMKFVRDVEKGKMKDAFMDGFKKSAKDFGKLGNRVAKLGGWMADMKKGQTLEFSDDGSAITVMVNGAKKGSVDGKDFRVAFWKIFLGPNPPNAGLKSGLLGK